MSKIIFHSKIYTKIEGFIDYRMDYFNRIYSDTGIFGEDTILNRYNQESRELSKTFVSAIRQDIERGIFGTLYKVDGNREYSRLVVTPGHHILIVWIMRDKGIDTVMIDDIEIRS